MNYLHSKLFLQLGFKLDSGRDSASKLLCGDPGSITVHGAGNEKKGKWAGPGGSLVPTPLRWGLEAPVETVGDCGTLCRWGSASEPSVTVATAGLPGHRRLASVLRNTEILLRQAKAPRGWCPRSLRDQGPGEERNHCVLMELGLYQ